MKRKQDPLSIIITDDPRHLPLILVDGVEAVLWKRQADPAVVSAIRNFDEARLGITPEKIKRDTEALRKKGWEGGQIYIDSAHQRNYPDLRPLWNERKALHQTLRKTFNLQAVYKQDLMIQPARRNTTDRFFHRDSYFMGPEYDNIFFLIAHKGPSTEVIPHRDAGRCTPYLRVNAVNYYHPLTLARKIQPEEHDVIAIRIKPEGGTIHRAPYIRSGTRWLSIYTIENTKKILSGLKGQVHLTL